MNLGQLRTFVVRPALQHIQLWTPEAENLVMGTAIVESAADFLAQVGGGPALGIWQMEPLTHDDIWANYIGYRRPLVERMNQLTTSAAITAGAHELVGNLFYAAAMCRVAYARAPEPLPPERDALAMAKLWKLRYNTPKGAGTVPGALPGFKIACGV